MCNIKAGIVGGLILFIWGAISWMVLPWHNQSFNNFNNEKAVVEVIQANAAHSGMYMMPVWEKKAVDHVPAKGPMMFASVHLEGKPVSMKMKLLISLATQILAALFVSWMLLHVNGGYFRKLSFVVIFALSAGIVSHVPYWNWFCFDMQFTLIQMADLLIGWFLAGLVLAKMCKKIN